MSERRIWTLHRNILGVNGAVIRVALKHFSTEKAAEDAKQQADDAFRLFFSGVLMINGQPAMRGDGLVAQMCIQAVGHDVTTGEVHEANLLEPIGRNGPEPKIFIPGMS